MSFTTAPFRRNPNWVTDFLTSSASQLPFTGAALAGGVNNVAPAAGVVTREHPGVVLLRSVATVASGYRYTTDPSDLRLGGGEVFDVVFWTPAAFGQRVFRGGLIDTVSEVDATDGCYFEFNGNGALVGKTASNGVRSTTAQLTLLNAAAWHHARVTLNADATSALFEVWSDAGVLLGSAALATNIPTLAGRETGAGVVAHVSTASAVDLVALDYMSVRFGRSLVRGNLS